MNFATLQHSVFLQALGSAILNSLWQGFILWIIYQTVNVIYKSASSEFRNKLSTLLIFSSFAWFLGTLLPALYAGPQTEMAPISSAALRDETTSGISVVRSIITYISGSLAYLSVAYIFLLSFLTAKLFSSYRYVYFIAKKRLISPPPNFKAFAAKVARQIHISRKISVWLSHHIDVPATIGFLKPVILIPVASINNLSNDQLEAIILHELSHIRRNDYLINLLISVIETVLFFNPFILLLTRAAKRERENCCDDFVIQYQYDPHTYASALLSIEQTRRTNLQLAIAAVSGKKQLLHRIKRITNNKVVSKQFNYGQKLIALILVTGVICSIAWLSPADNNTGKGKKLMAPEIKTSIVVAMTEDEGPGNVDINDKGHEPELNVEYLFLHFLHKSAEKSNSKMNDHPEGVTQQNIKAEKQHFLNDNSEFKKNEDLRNLWELLEQKDFLKMLPLKTLQELSLGHLDINLDLSETEKSLQQAYKNLAELDWNNIQQEQDINQSLFKIMKDKGAEIKLAELFREKMEELSTLRKMKVRTSAGVAELLLRKPTLIADSLRVVKLRSAGKQATRVNKLIHKGQLNLPVENDNTSYNFYYSNEPELLAPEEVELIQGQVHGSVAPGPVSNKNFKIILQSTKAEKAKESKTKYHFFLKRNYDTKKVQPHIISSRETMETL